MKVREALQEHHRLYDFGTTPGGYDDRWARVGFGPFTIRFPNFKARADALRLHDINHIVTGYPPIQWKGEMELAYFEFGTGLGKFWAGWMFDSLAIILALRWPISAWRAFRRGFNSRRSLYRHYTYNSQLLEKSVEGLRAELGI